MKRIATALALWAGLALSAEAATLDVLIFDDGFGSEIAFDVVDQATSNVVFDIGFGTIPDFQFQLNVFTTTLPQGDYTFTIRDFFGDGIIAPGGYALSLDNVVLIDKLTSGYTGFSESFDFSVTTNQAVPLPAAAPLFIAAMAGCGAVGFRRSKAQAPIA